MDVTVTGIHHVALWVDDLERAGVVVASAPRQTGDGYYEAVVLDPEGNRVEITE